MNQEVRNASFDFHDLEAMMTLGHLTVYSTDDTARVYAVADLYRRIMDRDSVEDLHPVGSIGYCQELKKDDPEYHEGDRYRKILEIIKIMSPEDSPMPFPILELFCRSADKDYDDKVIRSFMGDEKYYPHLENPEYDENARFREIYVHDSSFEEVDVMAGSKIRIDTRRKPRKVMIDS